MNQKNFLFISVDDLNDWTGGLGGYSGTVHTPNFDALMDQGTTFTNAFSQAAICNPSRTSALTGQEPQNTGVFQNQYHYWEERVDPADTIFGVFKEAGYNSQGVGKLFHTGASAEATATMFDDYAYLGDDHFGVETDGKPVGVQPNDETPADALRAERVADYLTEYDQADGPLLMSVGLLKPHLDWVVEQKYFDLYPLDEIEIDYVPNDLNDIPDYVLEVVGQVHPWSAEDVGSELVWKQLIQAYLATITFMDEQVGVMLDALDASDIADNTAVVLWSDHGYHLGDKDAWHKFTLWDNAARSPLIIRDAGTVPAGVEIDDPVELLDIFPTMLDMAGISEDGLSLDGKSLVPYFEGSAPEGEAAAFTWMYGNVSIRTAEYRYSLYEDGSEELYHVANDPELVTNLATDPSLAAVKAQLRADLYEKFHLVGYGDTAATLFGTEENNVFADTDGGVVSGLGGDDVYFVTSGTTVIEQADGGRDMIITSAANYTLPDFIEDLEVQQFATNVTGNDADNTIIASALRLDAKGGDDVVIAGLTSTLIFAGSGNDFVKAENGDDTVYGDTGADTIEGGNGNDMVFGGIGDDKLNAGNGDDSMLGGVGEDTLFGANGNDTLFGGTDADHIQGQSGNDSLFGEAGFDTLHGGAGDDLVDGGLQADLLTGGDGNDLLFGQSGLDHLYGDAGRDTLDGGEGNDRLEGGEDNDTLRGGAQEDLLLGQSGNDALFGDAGFDTLNGGIGNDLLKGGAQADELLGGTGNDRLFGQTGLDRLLGGSGNDTAFGGSGDDALFGELGDDLLLGEVGDDRLFGGFGNDLLNGGSGQDSLNGGAGSDRLFGSEGNDTLQGAEGADILYGGSDDDLLLGGLGQDRLFGSTGNDTAQGGSGNDVLVGDLGNDLLLGEVGNDRLLGGLGSDLLNGGSGDDSLSGGAGSDRLFGSEGNDTLQGAEGADFLDGGTENDVLSGGVGQDRLAGGAGNDTVRGGSDDDALYGEVGNDLLLGEVGNDRLLGGQGNDVLLGGSGHDNLSGGTGFDRLYGASGNDTLTGDLNGDQFFFIDNAGGFGMDVITDFDATNPFETINLSGVNAITDLSDLFSDHIAQVGQDVVINAGQNSQITLLGVSLADLDATDFIF